MRILWDTQKWQAGGSQAAAHHDGWFYLHRERDERHAGTWWAQTHLRAPLTRLLRAQYLVDVASPHRPPGIVEILGSQTDGGWHYLVMGLVKGVEWFDVVAPSNERPLPAELNGAATPAAVAAIMAQAMVALLFSHSAGVTHLDVKLENLMLGAT